MADKKTLSLVMLAAIFLFPFSVLCAQEEPLEPGYHIDFSGSEPKFIQRLVWEEAEYTLHYKIEIQIYSGMYTGYRTETADQNYIDVSLPPGSYRYNITTFDLLGRRGETSDWMEFTVIAAYQPRIERIVPEAFYMDQMADRILYIAGENILEESIIYLMDANKFVIFPYDKVIINSSRVRLFFDDDKLVPGRYNIIIQNPGGLNFSYDSIFIGYKKPLDIFLKMTFNPAVPVMGEIKDLFGMNLFWPCTGLSFEAVSSKRATFNSGIEFAVSTFLISPLATFKASLQEIYDNFSEMGKGVAFADFDMNLVLQRRFNKMRNTFTVRIGGGITLMAGFGENSRTEYTSHVNAGISSLFLLFDVFHLEVGCEASYYVGATTFIIVKPKLAMVWKR